VDTSVILEEGSVGDWVYVILEGSVKVRKKTPKGVVTVDTLKEGDVFGEMGFLEGGKRLRSASVVASGDVWVGILDGEKLTRDFELIPSNLRALIRSLALKLRKSPPAFAPLPLFRATSNPLQFLLIMYLTALSRPSRVSSYMGKIS
jgi:CRP-like cAMP-binding protein